MRHLIRLGWLCLGLLALAPSAARADDCGSDGQNPCGGDCEWYVRFYLIPWCSRAPLYCHQGYEMKNELVELSDGLMLTATRCRPKAVPPPPPPPPCGPACQADKINAALGTPAFASLNRDVRVSRAQAGLQDSDRVHLDVGGEGPHHIQSRCDGHDMVVNVNPDTTVSSGPTTGQPIPNLVLGYGQNLPFQDAFADEICAQSVPFSAEWAEEMVRVIKPGGRLSVCGPLGEAGYAAGLSQLRAHGLSIAATNNFGFQRQEVVFNVPPTFRYAPALIPGQGQCPAPALQARAAASSGCEVDMMVLYTQAAEDEARASGTTVEQVIHERVDAMNQALTNSQTGTRVRLVHLGKTSFDESLESSDMERINKELRGDFQPRTANVGAVERIQRLREGVGADLVSLFVSQKANIAGLPGSVCGIGFDQLTVDNGYSTVRWKCTANTRYALAHEAGHNLGLHHDRYTLKMKAGDDPTGYNYGHTSLVGSGFWTIMGYATECAANSKNLCSLIPYYSNPDLTYGGAPVGSATANNKKAIEKNAPLVAAYFPSAPARVFSPRAVDFGAVLLSGHAEPRTLELFNTTGEDVVIQDVTYSGARGLSVHGEGSTCAPGATLLAGRSCQVLIDFAPSSIHNTSSGTLEVSFQGGKPAVSAALRGESLEGEARLVLAANSMDLDPGKAIDFGNVVDGETQAAPLSFQNTGTDTLVVSAVRLPEGTPFRLSLDGLETDEACGGFPGAFTVPADRACRVMMSYSPHGKGGTGTVLTIESNDVAAPKRTVPVKGFSVRGEF